MNFSLSSLFFGNIRDQFFFLGARGGENNRIRCDMGCWRSFSIFLVDRIWYCSIFLRLVKYGASFTAGGMKGVSSLHLAAGCGLHEIFRVLSNDLLKDELSLSARDSFGLERDCFHALWFDVSLNLYFVVPSISSGRCECLDVSFLWWWDDLITGLSLLHWAALYGQLDVTRILVSIREDLCSLQDTYGLVPLDYAIMQRHADVIQVLVRFYSSFYVLVYEDAFCWLLYFL